MIPMRGVTACQEMERWKREKERELPGLFGPGLEERERASALVREGWGGWWWGFLCALFRAEVLTEGPWPPLSRNSLTLSLRAQRAHMLRHCMAGAFGKGRGGDRTVQAANQHNATPSSARGNWVHVPVLNEPLQRPQRWAQGSVREVVEAISVTVMSVCFLPSTSLLLCLICSVILHTVRLFTRTKMKWSVFSFTKPFCPT